MNLDRLETDQVYRAGYLAGAADACLEEYGASFDDTDAMQGKKAWHKGYAKGWDDYDRDCWRSSE